MIITNINGVIKIINRYLKCNEEYVYINILFR